jgi:hypothetical protein
MARLHSLTHAKQRFAAASSELFLSIVPKPNGGEYRKLNRQKRTKIAESETQRNRMEIEPFLFRRDYTVGTMHEPWLGLRRIRFNIYKSIEF